MRYMVISVQIAWFSVDFDVASGQLSKLVTDAIHQGWTPQGGVAYGRTFRVRRPCLLQAMVRS